MYQHYLLVPCFTWEVNILWWWWRLSYSPQVQWDKSHGPLKNRLGSWGLQSFNSCSTWVKVMMLNDCKEMILEYLYISPMDSQYYQHLLINIRWSQVSQFCSKVTNNLGEIILLLHSRGFGSWSPNSTDLYFWYLFVELAVVTPVERRNFV